ERPNSRASVSLLARRNFDEARLFGCLGKVCPPAPVAGRKNRVGIREVTVLTDHENDLALATARAHCGNLLRPVTPRQAVVIMLPRRPTAAWRGLPTRPHLALPVERPEEDASVRMTLSGGQLVNRLRFFGVCPAFASPVAPRAARRSLITGVELSLEIDAPYLRAAIAGLLRGREFVELR